MQITNTHIRRVHCTVYEYRLHWLPSRTSRPFDRWVKMGAPKQQCAPRSLSHLGTVYLRPKTHCNELLAIVIHAFLWLHFHDGNYVTQVWHSRPRKHRHKIALTQQTFDVFITLIASLHSQVGVISLPLCLHLYLSARLHNITVRLIANVYYTQSQLITQFSVVTKTQHLSFALSV